MNKQNNIKIYDAFILKKNLVVVFYILEILGKVMER